MLFFIVGSHRHYGQIRVDSKEQILRITHMDLVTEQWQIGEDRRGSGHGCR